MKVYIATHFHNQAEYEEALQLLVSMGHTITCNWTKESYEGKVGDELIQYRFECALADFQGVKDADALLIINHTAGKGMFVEFGMAMALSKPIFVAFPERVSNIFACMPGVDECSTIHDACEALDDFAHLKQLMQEGAAVEEETTTKSEVKLIATGLLAKSINSNNTEPDDNEELEYDANRAYESAEIAVKTIQKLFP